MSIRSINDTPRLLRDLDFAIAQLRHAYKHLDAERVHLQQEFARGLISPQIKTLETIRSQLGEGNRE